MSRKILFGAVASLALLAAFAMPSVSEAHGPRTGTVRHVRNVRHVRHVRTRAANCAPTVRTYHRYNGRYHTSRGYYHTRGVHYYRR